MPELTPVSAVAFVAAFFAAGYFAGLARAWVRKLVSVS